MKVPPHFRLLDARRPDLFEAWYAILRCVQPCELRWRCKALTWQEMAVALPERLQKFLAAKYDIVPAVEVNKPDLLPLMIEA